ncbi:MAG: L-lactate dehydrogenase [Crocinitomicaceae bacterium]
MSIAITVVGYGNVGRVLTNLLLGSDWNMELNIMDPADYLTGAFLDLKHASGLQPKKQLYFNREEVFKRSDYVFFTAGIPSKHGTSRLSTVKDNLQLVHDIFGGKQLRNNMRIVAITNPVDVITAAIVSTTNLPKEQVVGTGTFLDSMRFSYYLAELAELKPQRVEALILGEHGESCVPIVSHSKCSGNPLLENPSFTNERIEQATYQTLHAAFEIRKTEPGTSMAVSHCALRIMEYWMQPTETVIPISVLIDSEHAKWLALERPICMSLLVSISSKGIKLLKPMQLEKEELNALKQSAQILKEYQGFLK